LRAYLGGLKRTIQLCHTPQFLLATVVIACCAPARYPLQANENSLLIAVPTQAPHHDVPEGWWRAPTALPSTTTTPWPGTELWYVRLAPDRLTLVVGRYADPLTSSTPPVPSPTRWYVTQWRQKASQIELLELTPAQNTAPKAPIHTRVVTTVPIEKAPRLAPAAFVMNRTAPSPDGRFVACPTPAPAIVLADTRSGRPLASYRDAFDPAWDRAGRRLLLRSEHQIRGMLLITPAAPDNPSTIPGEVACQPARLSQRGNWFWQLQWHKRPARRGGFEVTPVLVRYHPGGGVRIVNTLWPLRLPIESARESVFLLDPPTDTHAVVLVRKRDSTGEIWEWEAPSRTPLRRLAELPVPLTPRAPLWTNGGERIIWLGPPPGVPALLNRTSFDLVPLLPSAVTEGYLLSGAVLASAQLLRTCTDQFPDPVCDLLHWPAPWQLEQIRDVRGIPLAFQQARRVARYTLRFATNWDVYPGRQLSRFELEARLWLSYLAGDYEETLRTADRVEPLLHQKTNRETLILVRLYALVGAEEWTQAANMLDALAELPGDWENGPEMEKALRAIGRIVDRMRHDTADE